MPPLRPFKIMCQYFTGRHGRSRTADPYRVKVNMYQYNLLILLINFNYIISYVVVFANDNDFNLSSSRL